VAFAGKIHASSDLLTKATTLSLFSIRGVGVDGGRTGEQSTGPALVAESNDGRVAGWIGLCLMVFTGKTSDAAATLLGLYRDGTMDLPVPTDMPEEVIAGTGFDAEAFITTFIVEDGTIVADANSYATVESADAYHANRGSPAAWFDVDVDLKEDALRQATAWLDMRYGTAWFGNKVRGSQSLMWPRVGIVDHDNILLPATQMPPALQKACAEAALAVLSGTVLLPTISAGSTDIKQASTTVGPISTSRTFQGGQSTAPRLPKVDALLQGAGLIASGSWGVR
jgi:hypothetical protein